MSTIFNRAARVAVNVMLLGAVVAFVAFGLGPHTGAYRTLTVLTNSMAPTFDAGDVVVMTPVRAEELLPGDVITYQAPRGDRPVVTHRVVDIVWPGVRPVVRTKGDANQAADPWTVQLDDSIVWRHRATLPAVGPFNQMFRGDAARMVTMYLLPLALVIAGLAVIWARPPRIDDEAWGWEIDEEGWVHMISPETAHDRVAA